MSPFFFRAALIALPTALVMQRAAGVPLECGEGNDFKTFRLGLFGLDKLKNPDRTISKFEDVLEKIC